MQAHVQFLRHAISLRGPHAASKCGVFNAYGPCENTMCSTFYEVPAGTTTVPPIGKPVPNTKCYVLDPRMHLVPIGVYGELYLGGVQLARGYFGRPDLTAKSFVPNPFFKDKDAWSSRVLYKTGDIVRWREDGNLEYQGRADHQVNIRGFRIEMGEVEAALISMPAVKEACALAREDSPGDKRLVGYVVLSDKQEVAASDIRGFMKSNIRGFMKSKVPEFMVPSAFVMLDAIPLTANQKIDRRALPQPASVEDDNYVGPRTHTERSLAAIWAKALRLDRVGVHSTFFELGGHSLLAVQMMSKIRATFKIDVPLILFFEHPSVASLAEGIELLQTQACVSALF